MACKIVIVLCFALFAAAVAKSLYNDDQVADLDGRIAQCLNRLPAGPSNACRLSAGTTPIKEGARREYRVEPIVECLTKAGIPQGPALKSAKYCLTLELWKPI
ncbi:uncharacterized protein LOC117641507 [Thrips palmi]|uniref:Uncharacterized protein LOC117641507 n=1 Tax=Thrips palmi TaxID=161013 RepID=A0A6P8YD39_THRPL|nr:uncharacterized protein LOC117641507 [Thrips palmi]XP_034234780.1 uncharacterized protein LOC117641507 [Thrips palmi]